MQIRIKRWVRGSAMLGTFTSALVFSACTAGISQQDYDSVQARFKEAETASANAQAQLQDKNRELASLTTPFKEWSQSWVRKAKTGSLKSNFEVKVLKTYEESGRRLIDPSPGDLLVYVNTSNQNWGVVTRPNEDNTNKFSRVNVINARTKKLLGTMEMKDKPGRVHTSAVTPDGRYAYVPAGNDKDAVLFKVDALTLQPLKMLDVGGTIHHMQVFQDKYLLVDTFGMNSPGGRAAFLLDPATDQIIGGIRTEALGGALYTVWPDPKQEYIYFLMEPADVPGTSAVFLTGRVDPGHYWVAKVDPKDWSVVREYPYASYRSDWIQFSADGKYMYLDGSLDDSLVKMSLETGEVVWKTDVGTGPYGIELTADGKEVWVTDKGESWKAHKGRTITVIEEKTGKWLDTIVPGGRGIDHLTLSPNGKEMWATSNDSGTVYVVDVATRQTIAEIPLPLFGDPHGVVFVHYNEQGTARVVADQGDFRAGVDPRNGKAIQ